MPYKSYLYKFDEVSGVLSYLDDNYEVRLDDYGIFRYYSKNDKYDLSPYEDILPSLVPGDTIKKISSQLFSNNKNIKYNDKIGYYLSTYAGHVLEGDFRKNGSSGGIGTWILCELLRTKEVDYIIHVKKTQNDDLLFKYDISDEISEVISGSKTKYYPTEISEVLKFVRENPGRYAIIGVPDIILSIRLLSNKDKIIKESIKYSIGLVCGHQKSSKFSECLAWQCGIEPGDLESIDFRKKNLNQPSNNYNIEVKGLINDEIKTIEKPTSQLIGQDWGQGYFKVEASDYNEDVMNETADMTIGDAWLKEYTNDSKGNNIVVVRNKKIQNIIENGIEKNKLKLDSVSADKIIKSQSAHYRHSQEELVYRLYKLDKEKVPRPSKNAISSKDIPFIRKKIQDLRQEISTSSHRIYVEAKKQSSFEIFDVKMKKISKKYKTLYLIERIQKHGIKGSIKVLKRKVFN